MVRSQPKRVLRRCSTTIAARGREDSRQRRALHKRAARTARKSLAASDRRWRRRQLVPRTRPPTLWIPPRSEEHTSELQSRGHLVCRLLLEKKKKKKKK